MDWAVRGLGRLEAARLEQTGRWSVREAPAHGPRPVKLLDRIRQALRIRGYSRRTEEAYILFVRRRKPHPTAGMLEFVLIW